MPPAPPPPSPPNPTPPPSATKVGTTTALRQFARARWCDCSAARWYHACPSTPPLSAQPAGDTRS
eukprot:4531682-Prymnesium_polylepis.1